MAGHNTKRGQKKGNHHTYSMKIAEIYKITVFFAMLCIGAGISLLLPLREDVSTNENRTLAKFPEFDAGSFMDGTYFAKVEEWFSDTFPFRDGWIQCNEQLESLYGIREQIVHGGIAAADDIPEVEADISNFNKIIEFVINSAHDAQPDLEELPKTDEDEYEDEEKEENQTETEQIVNAEDIGTCIDGTDGTTSAQEGERLGSIFVVGSSAYNYYCFSQANSDRYVETVNGLADSLEGKAVLFDMIVPTSMDITLDDATRNSLTSSNQEKAILYMYSRMKDNVQKSYIYEKLREHRDEYVYFRTDHHWTSLGAYYAYNIFITQLGKEPVTLQSYEQLEFGGFKGSFYTQSGVPSLGDSPDKVYAYKPLSTNCMKYLNRDGVMVDYNIVTDVSSWSASSKYSTFIGGDNAYASIHNPNLSDGSSCLVVKESFGNAFVPYLADHFETVHVVDYRYFNGTVSGLVDEYDIGVVLMLNNISATSTSERVNEMSQVCR